MTSKINVKQTPNKTNHEEKINNFPTSLSSDIFKTIFNYIETDSEIQKHKIFSLVSKKFKDESRKTLIHRIHQTSMKEVGFRTIEDIVTFTLSYGKYLKKLDLRDLPSDDLKPIQITDEQYEKLTRFCPNLNSFYTEHATVTENAVSSICRLKNLTILSLKHNKLENLPKEIKNLTNLTKLSVCHTFLNKLPEGIKKLSKLTKLSLKNNRLTNLPTVIGNLMKLIKLDISDNCIKELPEEISNLNNLSKLNLFKNKLTTLPNLNNLTTLNISSNLLTTLPKTILKLKHLTTLNIAGNNLTQFPNEVTQLINLSELDVRFNEFKSLPKGVSHLKALKITS